MKTSTAVCGVGMVPFAKPGDSEPYYEMGRKAAIAALRDAGIDYEIRSMERPSDHCPVWVELA